MLSSLTLWTGEEYRWYARGRERAWSTELSKKAYSIGKRGVFSMWRYAVRGAHNILF